jgi:hypothetical protein
VFFELRYLDTGKLIHRYATESAALAFVRDVVRVGGHDQAAQFMLEQRAETDQPRLIAAGALLVRRALEDRAE